MLLRVDTRPAVKRPTKRAHHASLLADYAESRGCRHEEVLDSGGLDGSALERHLVALAGAVDYGPTTPRAKPRPRLRRALWASLRRSR